MRAHLVSNTLFEPVGIEETDGAITRLKLPGETFDGGSPLRETTLLREAIRQIDAYCSRKLRRFDLPLNPEGTPFMRLVWEALCRVPFGKTATYKEVAEAVGHPKAYRAVGLANNRNPIPLLIPCHRIVGADGSLTGFRGGLGMKQALLEHEAGPAV